MNPRASVPTRMRLVLLALALAACGGSPFSSDFSFEGPDASGGAGGALGPSSGPAGGSDPSGFGPASGSSTGSAGGAGGLGGSGASGGASSTSSSSASASGSGGAAPCGPATCGGCCDESGTCQIGDSAIACGQAGEACVPCIGLCSDWRPAPVPMCSTGLDSVLKKLCWLKECLTLAESCCNVGQHCDDAAGACVDD